MALSRLDRRAFLRGAAIGGGGLLAAYAVGCKSGGSGGETPAATPTVAPSPTAGASPAATEPAASSGWRRIEVSGLLPPPRRDHSIVTDGERLYLFGGRGDGTFADLWTYGFAAGEWSELPAAGPAARFGHNAVLDPVSGSLLMFGGQAEGGGFFDDAWAFDPAAGEWTELPPGGSMPAPRYGSASAMDPDRGLVISHGFTDAGRFDDSWGLALGGAGWIDLSPDGDRPLKRCLVRGAWDREGQRFLLFGGQSNEAPYLGDTWELTADGWRELANEGPAPRHFYAMAFDEDARSIALFGGLTAGGPAGDTWLFDAAADSWSEASLEGGAPTARSGHDAVWAPASGSLVVFGGEDESGNLNDLWELTLPA